MKYCKKGDIRFNLKKIKDKKDNLQIYLIFNFEGNRLRFYTGRRTSITKWDQGNQRIKPNYTESGFINGYLTSLKNFIEKEYNDAKTLGEKITVENLREKLNTKINKSTNKSFFTVFDEFIEIRKTTLSKNTTKTYLSTLNHLKDFTESKKYFIEFDSITLGFEDSFRKYLINDVGLTNNSITKYFKTLKTFLNFATERNLNTSLEYKKFKTKETEGEIIYLTWDELNHLYNKNLESEHLNKMRDIFCFGCFTGLRYSDIKNLKKDNISNGMITIKTIKTKKDNVIPLNKYSRHIFEKYKNTPGQLLFNAPSSQKMNDALKKVGKEADLNEQVLIVKYKGSERIELFVPKHEVLSTHIARKTFITNALEKGIPTEVIMDITTHETHKVFKRYYKIIDEHKRKEMTKAFGE